MTQATHTTDILVMGGGIIGLAIALELRSRGAAVTVLTRDRQEAAAQAAAGMLAPHAEGIESAALLDLGQKSLSLYPDWIRTIENLSQLSTGYWPCGILAPQYARPDARLADGEIAATSLSSDSTHKTLTAEWLDASTLHQCQPGLGNEVVGGWWYPDDGQVDNRALFLALWAAAEKAGVVIQNGVTVTALHQAHGFVREVWTESSTASRPSETWVADHYILATGAWSLDLLPIPIQPLKGQMLSVRKPDSSIDSQRLRRVLFGEDIYIVPRQDGRVLIGATVESVGFTPGTTPAGLRQLLDHALRLYPALSHYSIEEHWWGFRPATPDHSPILGASHCNNLTLATGHHRNGILLAPVTALLIADWVCSQASSDLLSAFSWSRFRSSSTTDASAADSSPSISLPVTMPTLYSSASDTSNSGTPDAKTLDPTLSQTTEGAIAKPLVIAGRSFQSRLMTGTGKYRTFDQMRQSVAASGCEIVTVAVRRVQTQAPGHEGLAEALDWSKVWMLPNTAGCKTAEEAIRVARLGREMAKLLGQEDNNFVKLEVIPDATHLLPDPIGTLEAAEQLVKEGFAVLPYINADPMLAKRLEEAGCATVMPLGSPIGSGQGIRNTANIEIIIENSQIPVVVDAGIGTPSEAAQAMEMGADALLINTAIAQASDPASMALAMKLATEAGRIAHFAGRIPVKTKASASSPLTGTISS
ncbi:MAG: glycine oxidase ThiO [Elainellaceae cyanobacterium]